MNVHDKYKPLTWWEKTYLPAIISGVLLTFGHFRRNMVNHIKKAIGMKPKVSGAVTFQYPEVRRPFWPRLRTLHRLVRREDGSPRCVGCMMCETVCPAHCIYIVAEERPENQIEKQPRIFDIDLGKCIFCGYCVEACPEDAIRMDTGIVEISAYTRNDMMIRRDQLLSLEPKKEYYTERPDLEGKPVL
ncbi:MAG: NADH-quinone oxidoreductase subunit I [Deferribacteres bacterium]|nr:NADH-quinone oxidoreductase subunit I [candidate division KSB1 bacterium]MCB9511058.1 NADH-quinone oxidoreductase subunit I [Deferribacteres bacterium]